MILGSKILKDIQEIGVIDRFYLSVICNRSLIIFE